MTSNWIGSPSRVAAAGLGLFTAWACTVVNKGDYTFSDEPSESGQGSGATSGKANGGAGGSTGGAGGTTTAGKGGKGGTGGTGGKGGSAGRTGPSTSGGAPATGGSTAAGAGGKGGSAGKTASAGTGGGPLGAGGSAGKGIGPLGGQGGAADACDPSPCSHGDCSLKGDGYLCTCDDGFTGTRCQTNIDDCTPNPCMNGGKCQDKINDYRCDCNGTGFSGTNCQTAGPCIVNPCLHGGVCTDTGGGNHTCDCTGTGYESTDCTVNHDDCPANACHEDEGGTCNDQVNGYACSYPKSCAAAYNAGMTAKGPLYIDPDGGDASNAEERYCYYGYAFTGLGFGLHGTYYGGNWSEAYRIDVTGNLGGAFLYLYNKQGGITNLQPQGTWNIGYCCFRDPQGAMIPPQTGGFLGLASVGNSAYLNCQTTYSDPLMYLYMYPTPTPSGLPPIDASYYAGWTTDTSASGTCPSSGATLGMFWNYYYDYP
jgi:hypothetical protein